MSRRGFSVVELVVAVALIAILAAMSTPMLVHATRKGQLRTEAQALVTDVGLARSVAVAGAERGAPWDVGDRTRSAGLMIVDARSWLVFADRDTTDDGDEVVLRTVVLPLGLRIVSPTAGSTMRFRPNGTISGPFDVVVEDEESHTQRRVVVASGGYARVL
ncbi:GspH/FimT family protein [Myxococcota bacterium]|nr:GspH/FimT family protein [Myxococcota bacterium]